MRFRIQGLGTTKKLSEICSVIDPREIQKGGCFEPVLRRKPAKKQPTTPVPRTTPGFKLQDIGFRAGTPIMENRTEE